MRDNVELNDMQAKAKPTVFFFLPTLKSVKTNDGKEMRAVTVLLQQIGHIMLIQSSLIPSSV